MQPGDTIKFFHRTTDKTVTKTISEINLYYSFEEMLEYETPESIGDRSKGACIKGLKSIYHYDFSSMIMAIHLK
jgi:ASC-1-like (ASCH) protein